MLFCSMEFGNQSPWTRETIPLRLHDQLIQLLFETCDTAISCLFHGIQFVQCSADLTLCAGNRIHRLADLIANGPVCKQAIKEIVRKPQEAIDIDLHIGSDLYVCQFGFEASELALEFRNQVLCLIQVAVLSHVGDDATAAKHIPGIPSVGAVKLG